MTIDTRDKLIAGLASGADRILIDKASLSNAVAGQVFSLWAAGSVPAAGAAPNGLFRSTDRGHRVVCQGIRDTDGMPADQPRDAAGKGFHR